MPGFTCSASADTVPALFTACQLPYVRQLLNFHNHSSGFRDHSDSGHSLHRPSDLLSCLLRLQHLRLVPEGHKPGGQAAQIRVIRGKKKSPFPGLLKAARPELFHQPPFLIRIEQGLHSNLPGEDLFIRKIRQGRFPPSLLQSGGYQAFI